MKKFKVNIPCDYIQGHLRYGHLEGIVEVASEDELKELIDSKDILDYLDVVVDDYEVNDYEANVNQITYKEEHETDNE